MLTINGPVMVNAKGTVRRKRNNTPAISCSPKTNIRECDGNMTVKYCWASSDGGGGCGIKCRKPFKPKTMKINATKYRAIVARIFIKFSFFLSLFGIDAGA